MIQKLKNTVQLGIVFFILTIFFDVGAALAVTPTAQKTSQGAVDRYTYETACTNIGNTLKTARHILVPTNGFGGRVSYVYLHGNDQPNGSDLCSGKYHLCQVADELAEAIIIPETKVTGNSVSQTVSSAQMKCVLDEARAVMLANGVELPATYSLAAHSAGAWLANKIVANNIQGYTLQDTLIFDGCYGGGNNGTGSGNWCTQIVGKVQKMYVYYQNGDEGTPAGSKAVKDSAPTKVVLSEVGATHWELPDLCFADHRSGDRCKGRVDATGRAASCQIDVDCVESGLVCRDGSCVKDTSVPGTLTPPTSGGSSAPSAGTSGCRPGQDCVPLTNPLATTDIKVIMGNTIKVVMGIVGSITLVIFLYGGFLWLTSGGNSEKIQKGLQAMLWAGIGIIVVFSSYAIITLILTTLQQAP